MNGLPRSNPLCWYNFDSFQRLVDDRISIQTVLGFNNTGNVCEFTWKGIVFGVKASLLFFLIFLGVWPAEEIMTYFCLQNKQKFRFSVDLVFETTQKIRSSYISFFSFFRHKRICEIGGGMTCLAGLFVRLNCWNVYTSLASFMIICHAKCF